MHPIVWLAQYFGEIPAYVDPSAELESLSYGIHHLSQLYVAAMALQVLFLSALMALALLFYKKRQAEAETPPPGSPLPVAPVDTVAETQLLAANFRYLPTYLDRVYPFFPPAPTELSACFVSIDQLEITPRWIASHTPEQLAKQVNSLRLALQYEYVDDALTYRQVLLQVSLLGNSLTRTHPHLLKEAICHLAADFLAYDTDEAIFAENDYNDLINSIVSSISITDDRDNGCIHYLYSCLSALTITDFFEVCFDHWFLKGPNENEALHLEMLKLLLAASYSELQDPTAYNLAKSHMQSIPALTICNPKFAELSLIWESLSR